MKIVRSIVCGALLICLTVLTACESCKEPAQSYDITGKTEYHVIEYSYTGYVKGANHKKEYAFWKTGIYEDPTVKNNTAIRINGKKIVGEYVQSIVTAPDNYHCRHYKTQNKDYFWTDPDGKVVGYIWKRENMETPSQDPLTERQLISIAREFLCQFENVDDYQVCIKQLTVHQSNLSDNDYEIQFTKYIDGYPTADSAVVTITKYGALSSFATHMFGRISRKTKLRLNYDAAVEAVYQKMDTIYSPLKEAYDTITYGTPRFTFIVLENGDPAMYCEVHASIKKGMWERGETALLIVEL